MYEILLRFFIFGSPPSFKLFLAQCANKKLSAHILPFEVVDRKPVFLLLENLCSANASMVINQGSLDNGAVR